jgi:hypothetical protein
MKKKSLFLTAVATLGLTAATMSQTQPALQWIRQASLPISGEPLISFSLNGFGYWGEINGKSTLWKYNPSTNTWTQQQDLPMPSSQMPAFTVNGKAYYMPISDGKIYVYEYQSSMDSWSQVSIFPGKARGGSFVFTIGPKVYMAMGSDFAGNHLSDVWEFDATNYQFSQKSNFPFEDRWGGSAFTVNEKGYIGMGNLNWNFSDPNGKDLYEYNPITDVWTQKANLPVNQGRYATTGFSISNYGYVLGGDGTGPLVSYDEFWRYDPDNDSWLKMPAYGGGGANYLKSFVIDNTCYSGKGPLWSFNVLNCANNTVVNPQTNSMTLGSTATFNASTSNPNPIYVWQSDFGQGFQTLNNFGNYSGVNTATLNIANIQLSNHNLPIRVISTSGNCIDTSNVAIISVLDTCVFTFNDTLLTAITDTLIINTQITGINSPNNQNTLKVFPNPASTHITIDYGNFNAMSGYTLTIVNSIGQTVFTTPIVQQISFIDFSTWTGNGIYFLQLIDPQNNTLENRKIVIH